MGEPSFPSGKPLYNLNLIAFAQRKAETVWLTEGESKADALRKLGLLSTTTRSATSADSADWGVLKDRAVTVWRDNDEAGLR
jgi:DNA primase